MRRIEEIKVGEVVSKRKGKKQYIVRRVGRKYFVGVGGEIAYYCQNSNGRYSWLSGVKKENI